MEEPTDSLYNYQDTSPKPGLHIPPDPEDMNNKRAAAAERALESFSRDFGEWHPDIDLRQQNLADLLADFAHLCDRKGLNMVQILDGVRKVYAEETDNEGRQFMGGVFQEC